MGIGTKVYRKTKSIKWHLQSKSFVITAMRGILARVETLDREFLVCVLHNENLFHQIDYCVECRRILNEVNDNHIKVNHHWKLKLSLTNKMTSAWEFDFPLRNQKSKEKNIFHLSLAKKVLIIKQTNKNLLLITW